MGRSLLALPPVLLIAVGPPCQARAEAAEAVRVKSEASARALSAEEAAAAAGQAKAEMRGLVQSSQAEAAQI